MLGILDIGNTNFHLAVMNGDKIERYFTFACDKSEELQRTIEITKTDKLIISYVSSKCYSTLRVTGVKKLIIGNEAKNKIRWAYETMGIDRVANVFYLLKSGINGIVISFGTMFVIDVVKDNKFMGGMIFPGYYSQIDCVNMKADLINSEGEIDDVELLGMNTENAVKYGVYNILRKGLPGVVYDVSKRYGLNNIIATGGDIRFLTYLNARYDKYLTIKGIKLIAEDVYDCNWS